MSDLEDRLMRTSSPVANGGGESTAGERFWAGFDQWRLNEGRALFNKRAEEIYDQEASRLKTLTGVELVNPFRYTRGEMERGNRDNLFGSSFERFEQMRARLAAQRPNEGPDIDASQHTLADLYAEQRRIEAASESAVDRSPSAVHLWLLGKVDAAALAGGVAGSFTDPLGIAQNLIGPGGRTAKGAAGVVWGGIKAAAGNAAVTAASQPFVQDWRKQAGLENGLSHAAMNVAGAAAFGFLADAGVRTGYRGVQAGRGRVAVADEFGNVTGYRDANMPPAGGPAASLAPLETPAAPAPAAAIPDTLTPDVDPAWVARLAQALREEGPEAPLDLVAQRAPDGSDLRLAADGNPAALDAVARALGADADPEVRGGLAELERLRLFGEMPEDLDAARMRVQAEHLTALSDAMAHVMDPDAPPMVAPDAVAHTLDANGLTPELAAARQRLVDQDGSPLDLAAIMRARPDLVTADLHLTDSRLRAARSLAKLSDEAFDKVASGEIAPALAVQVARHVADTRRHVEIARSVAKLGAKNDAERKAAIAELLARPGDSAPHLIRIGGDATVRDAVQRRAVAERAAKLAVKDARVIEAIEREAQRVEAGSAAKGQKSTRVAIAKTYARALEEMARGNTHVAELVGEARLAEGDGIPRKVAADALAGRLAAEIEAGGLESLAKPRKAAETARKGFDDPFGPEAQAQIAALSERAKFSIKKGGDDGQQSGGPGGTAGGGAGAGRGDGASADGGGKDGRGENSPGRGSRRAAGSPQTRPDIHTYTFDKGTVGTVIRLTIDDDLRFIYYVHDAKASALRLAKGNALVADKKLFDGGYVARVELIERFPGLFEVERVGVDLSHRGKGIAKRLYDHIERDLGITMHPPGTLTKAGHGMWSKRRPGSVAHHRFSDREGLYLSPQQLKRSLNSAIEDADAKAEVHYRALLDSVPAEVKSEEALRQMFRLSDPSDLTPSGAAKWNEIRDEVWKIARRLPREVRLDFFDKLTFGGRGVDGVWDPTVKLVRIALGDGMDRVLKHEEIHVLRDLGLLSDTEFQVLVKRGLDDGQMKRFDIEGRYTEAYRARYAGDAHALKAAMHEEMVAEMFGGYRRGERYGATIDGLFKRLDTMLERLGNAVRGLGFQSAEDIFRRIETGEVAERARPTTRFKPSGRAYGRKLSIPLTKTAIAMPEDLGRLIGVPGRRLAVDADYIVRKRQSKDSKFGNKTVPELADSNGVLRFIEDTLSQPAYAFAHNAGDAWNVYRARPDGLVQMVSVAATPDADGSHFIKTAFVEDGPRHVRRASAAMAQSPDGMKALKIGDDPEALKTALALFSSQAHRATPDHTSNNIIAALKQRIDTFDMTTPGQRLAAEADRLDTFHLLAEACKR